MAFLFLLAILLQLSIALQCTISVGLHEAFFRSEPRDAHIREGENAIYTCSVAGFNRKSDFLTWAVKPTLYTNVISESYNELANIMTSVLTVFNAGKEEQTHQCILQRIDADFFPHICSSRVTRLDVQYLPNQEEIKCGPNNAAWIREHNMVTFWCKAQQGNPSVMASWRIENLTSVAHEIDNENGLLTFQDPLRVEHWMHDKTLQCLVHSPAFPGVAIFCRIGPLKILPEPRVSISPTDVSFRFDTPDARERLFCKSDGIYDFDNVLWSCLPRRVVLGCDGTTTKQVEMHLNTSSYSNDLTYVTVICSAFSSEVRAEDKLNITLIPAKTTNISCRGVEIEEVGHFDNVSDVGYIDVVYSCFLHCKDMLSEHVQFSWFIDDDFVKEDFIETTGANELAESFLNVSFLIKNVKSLLNCTVVIDDTSTFMQTISLRYLFLPYGTTLQSNVTDSETETAIITETLKPSTPCSAPEMDDMGLKLSSNRNNFYDEINPFSTRSSKLNMQTYSLKPDKSLEGTHVASRTTLTVVSAVGASIFILLCLIAVCNVIMFRHLRKTSTNQSVIHNDEYWCSHDSTDSLYEEPMSNENRPLPPILGTQQTIKEHDHDDGSVSQNSSTSNSSSIISSGEYFNSSSSLEFQDIISDNGNFPCPQIQTNDIYDESRFSVDPCLYESMSENDYDNQKVVEMHRIGKPRTNPTKRNCSYLSANIACVEHQLPLLPSPTIITTV